MSPPRRVTLLLQGPVGPFFGGLAAELRRRGDEVRQVCFNGGDRLFAARGTALPYTGDEAGWPAWLSGRLEAMRVDRVVLFGDCRPLHRAAIAVCREAGVAVWVCEEGYLRPHYLTLERDGVNAHSRLPRDPAAIRALPAPPAVSDPRRYRWVMTRRAVSCVAYYLAMALARRSYPHYRHHRRSDLLPEAWCWLRAAWRRAACCATGCGVLPRLRRIAATRPVFLMPLQVEGDSQIVHHAPFADVAASIGHVVASFAAHAPSDAVLVVKHHPMDRGYHDHGPLLRRLAALHGLGDRLVAGYDQPLPELFRLAAGVVTVNSTVGLSALTHGLPVICLGRALYDIEGLTHRGPLGAFWRAPQPPDREPFARFRAHLLATTQLNACSASAASGWDLLDRLPGFAPLPQVELETDGSPEPVPA